jgi:hypothetical protein
MPAPSTPPNWPDDLPTPLIEGFSDGISEGRTMSKPTLGIGKRRAFWKGVRTTLLTMNVDGGQWARLQSFWEVDTNYGVWVFIMDDPVRAGMSLSTTGGTVITTSGGSPIVLVGQMLCRFGETPPKIDQAYKPDLFKISFPLEVLP